MDHHPSATPAPSYEAAAALWELSSDLLAVANQDGYFTVVNSGWERVLGRTATEMTSRPYLDFVHPDDIAATLEAAQLLLEPGHVTSHFENRYQAADGHYRWLDWNVRAADDGTELYCSARDVTELKRAEHEADQAGHYSRTLIEASLDPLVTISAEGRIMDVNTATEAVTGVPRTELIGSDFTDYFTDPDQARAGYRQAFSQGRVTDYPLAIRHTSGTITDVLYNATVYRDERGDIAGVFAAARDVTDLKRAEHEADQAGRYSRTLIEASLDPLVTISAEGRIMDVNTATETVTGVPRTELIGSDFTDYFTDPDQARAGYRQAFSQGRVTDYPLAIRHTSGTITDVLYNATVYRDERGDIAGVFAAARDVTDLKRSRLELANSRQMAAISQMANLLQLCHATEEAFPIIKATMTQLFPESSGACFIMNHSVNLLQEVTQWGGMPPIEPTFAPDDCWALRRGHLHEVASEDINPRCKHLELDGNPYACVPLTAQGEALGVLYVSPGEAASSGATRPPARLLQMVADSVSLAVSSLNLRESLRAQSVRDELTGLYNRRFTEEILARELVRMRRVGLQMVVAMLDLDDFKQVNDGYGHDAGDAVLLGFAGLTHGLRKGSDVVCRYGGDEFIVILPETSPDEAMPRIEELRNSIGLLRLSNRGQILPRVTASVGIAAFPTNGTTVESLVRAADVAMYQAKSAGRNCIMVSDAVAPDDLSAAT